MGFDNRKLLAPAAAFTMAVIVISYTYSSINQARSEATSRRIREVEFSKSKGVVNTNLKSKSKDE